MSTSSSRSSTPLSPIHLLHSLFAMLFCLCFIPRYLMLCPFGLLLPPLLITCTAKSFFLLKYHWAFHPTLIISHYLPNFVYPLFLITKVCFLCALPPAAFFNFILIIRLAFFSLTFWTVSQLNKKASNPFSPSPKIKINIFIFNNSSYMHAATTHIIMIKSI